MPTPAAPLPDVLVVDDNPLDRRWVRRVLAGRARVHEASTLAVARGILAARPAVLVVIDLHLPDGFGTTLVDAVGDATVVLMTDDPRGELPPGTLRMTKSGRHPALLLAALARA